jgi:2-dehydro-3-deoxyphosphooctonate aldolase (KDO 8-P synthase)
VTLLWFLRSFDNLPPPLCFLFDATDRFGYNHRMMRTVRIGNIVIGNGHPLALIAGPCVIESEDGCRLIAQRVKEIAAEVDIPLIFKASFDKANRSSVSSFRGPGLLEGLRILAGIQRDFGLPLLTDVHETGQVETVAEVVDIIQIPAFLCRQTDLLLAAGKTGKAVNVKKGQFLAPHDMRNVVEKIASVGNHQILLTERGTSFGYNNLVVDMRSLAILRGLGYPVVFDATHSVQLPGGQGASSGGQREFVPVLTRAAVAVGVDALFLEVHDNPDAALSDGPNMMPLEQLAGLLRQAKMLAGVGSESMGR